MPRGRPMLSDQQWKKIEPLLPKLPTSQSGGRPWTESRRVLEGILWIARSGARWQDLPAEYSSPSTCWRRLRDWEEQDVWLTIWRTFLGELNRKGDWTGAKPLLTAVSLPRKRGCRYRQDQAGQGYKVDGGGRWQGCSFGKSPGIGVPSGSQTGGNDAGFDPRPEPPWAGPSASKAAKSNCRQSLR